jgi:hypothetical protein
MNEGNVLLDDMTHLHEHLMKMLAPFQQRKDPDAPAAGGDRMRDFLWAAYRDADVLLDDLLMPRDLDLDRDDPATAQEIEEFVAWRFFQHHPSGDPWEILIPQFTPQQGELKAFYQHGRWFCTWLKLDEDMSRPEKASRQLLVVNKEQDGRIGFVEV